jgi:response regulator RpfG family c-di-GMP phosphodiesterase
MDINKKVSKIVLIDDDNVSNLFNEFVLRDIMKFTGVLQICLNGKTAINYLTNKGEFASKGKSYPRPELILLDINMPIMNGFEFIKEHEKIEPEIKGDIIICMLTSSLDSNDHKRATNITSLAEFLYKPLTKESLIKVIDTHFLD